MKINQDTYSNWPDDVNDLDTGIVFSYVNNRKGEVKVLNLPQICYDSNYNAYVLNLKNSYSVQICFIYTNGEIYWRTRKYDGWTIWFKI